MNTEEIELVQNSFSRIVDAEQDFAEVFYDTLFANTPSARTLFNGDMKLQRNKLKTTVALVVKGMHKFDDLKNTIYDLGKRHVDYGVHPHDFPDVADALLKTFDKILDDFSIDEEDAWKKALDAISGTMLEAWEH